LLIQHGIVHVVLAGPDDFIAPVRRWLRHRGPAAGSVFGSWTVAGASSSNPGWASSGIRKQTVRLSQLCFRRWLRVWGRIPSRAAKLKEPFVVPNPAPWRVLRQKSIHLESHSW